MHKISYENMQKKCVLSYYFRSEQMSMLKSYSAALYNYTIKISKKKNVEGSEFKFKYAGKYV